MKIVNIKCIPITLRYRKPFTISGGVNLQASHVLVRVTTNEGIEGFGEACPMPAYGEETQESVVYIVEKYFSEILSGKDPLQVEALLSRVRSSVRGHHFAKAAIDQALYDLSAKLLGLPLVSLLGGPCREGIEVGWSIGIDEPDKMAREAYEFKEKGCLSFKVKLSGNQQADIDRVMAVREAIGTANLRVDANQGYRYCDARRVFRRMEVFDLQYIEQPLPSWDLEGHSQLRRVLDTPIMLDESCYTPEDGISAITHDAADIINIKVSKCGISGARKIAAIAEGAGIPCLVGSMIESGVGTAASLHFALACMQATLGSELVGPVLLDGDVVQDQPYSVYRPFLSLTSGIGLGIDVRDREVK